MFRVLGALQVEVDGATVDVPSARQRALLAALLLTPNTVVAADRLVEVVWGDDLPQDPRNALQNLVTRLRRLLGDDGRVLVTRAPGYLLAVDPSSVDATRFERACAEGRSRLADDPAAAVAVLREALGTWRGPAWGDQADGVARGDAQRLEDLRRAAEEDLVAGLLAAGEVDDAVGRAQALVVAEPLRERPVELLVRSLVAAGRTGDALAAYRRHRDLVGEELGLEPSASLRELEARVLREELDPPASPRPAPRPTGPGPRALARHASLPWRPSALLGRDDEVTTLLDHVGTRRLTTLVGPGGVGKTRLALEVAHRLAGSGERTWWVDLVPVEGDRVVDAIARVLGVTLGGETESGRALAGALQALEGVLVLDNAEHVVASVAAVAEELVAGTAGLRMLVTSRERLAVDEEQVVPVAPLPVPDAADRDTPVVQLFLARWVRPAGEEPDAADVARIAGACRALDGLPLAIELAAAQASALGLRDVTDRLGDRLDLLAGGRRTADARHRTLRAVVDWSVDLLDERELRLFTRLAVFPGTCSLDQVEAVCADDLLPRGEVAASLARLVEQSLVQRVQGRHGMLETLHQYARDRLQQAGEERELARRHAHDTADRLAALVADLWSPREASASAELTRLIDDLHAAWAHAVVHDRDLAVRLAADVYDFAYYRQHLPLMDWGRVVAAWDVDHPRMPAALATAASACWTRGQLDEARVLAERGVALAGGDTSPDAVPALDVVADLVMFEGRAEEAVTLYLRAGQLHVARGRDTDAVSSRVAACQARSYGPRWREALDELQELVHEAEATGCPSVVTFAHYALGEALSHVDHDAARAAYRRAIEVGVPAGSRLFVMIACAGMLAQIAQHDRLEHARAAFEIGLDRWEVVGNEALQWWTLLSVVVLLERVGADEPAARLAGAVRAAVQRRPAFGPDTRRLDDCVDRLEQRLGPDRLADALAAGATLDLPGAVALARTAFATAGR